MSKDGEVSDLVYPCTQCGACCRRLNDIETTLPRDETGRCDHLIDTVTPEGRPISICSVYETRMEIDCPTLNSVKPAHMPWSEFYPFMVSGCESLQQAQGIDESYKPKINSDLATQLLVLDKG
jgi:uncharacterized cysteine cluster protein YcgN (CxxCxxCC family)